MGEKKFFKYNFIRIPGDYMRKKRYKITIEDRLTRGKYEFEEDFFQSESSKGIVYTYDTQGKIADIKPNGHIRHTFKLWSGFTNWEDFKERIDEKCRTN